MNSLVIVLGIVIIFFIYLLFKYLSNTSSMLVNNVDFSKSVPTINSVASPTNTSYAYGIWLYVQKWDANSKKIIFNRKDNIKLYLENSTPTLLCDVIMNETINNAATIKNIQITNSFPLQKWVCIIISIDNQILDCYLDGKLVLSQQVTKTTTSTDNKTNYIFPATPSDKVVLSLGGDSTWSANALLFTRWTTAVDPQTAWDWYMKGNGKSKIKSLFTSYGVNYSILKDDVAIVNNQPLF